MTDENKTCKQCVQAKNVIVQQLGQGAEGCNTTASGDCSHSEGFMTLAAGFASHAEGAVTMANGTYSHAEGFSAVANGIVSHAEGFQTSASGVSSHAEGANTGASGAYSHAEGFSTVAGGAFSHSEGRMTTAGGDYSHTEGHNTTASGEASHAEGNFTTANGNYSHTEGQNTTAAGLSSHAEGVSTSAGALASHAEGIGTTASGMQSHAEGSSTTAIGVASHAEGSSTSAIGDYSHAQGFLTNVGGFAAHAEGQITIASGDMSHAEGFFTDTNNMDGAHIMGLFGQATDPFSWFLANGTGPGPLMGIGAKIIRNDPLEPGVTNAYIDGAWIAGGADYAEMFEIVDGQPIDPGYFITMVGKKIRKYQTGDNYILGVTSANYSVLANSGELRWKGKYLTDEWGRVLRQEAVIPAKTSKEGSEITREWKELQPVLNPAWDGTQQYVSRLKRPEWVAVGLMGQVLVWDDGTCQVNGFCTAGDGGIATAAPMGYRVLERTGDRQILILLK